ncbi:Hypothetical protein FKW44_025075 [Caligus rogercresseyi]|uniref:Uncharacterized protein n=1 Tax=Caligus rogercresseyi TaxID=217165 RepID=A0A7T8JSE0_CALRO|nr:Hypothetical protein FKW44_025075 [Caligus rogercresseyi]
MCHPGSFFSRLRDESLTHSLTHSIPWRLSVSLSLTLKRTYLRRLLGCFQDVCLKEKTFKSLFGGWGRAHATWASSLSKGKKRTGCPGYLTAELGKGRSYCTAKKKRRERDQHQT